MTFALVNTCLSIALRCQLFRCEYLCESTLTNSIIMYLLYRVLDCKPSQLLFLFCFVLFCFVFALKLLDRHVRSSNLKARLHRRYLSQKLNAILSRYGCNHRDLVQFVNANVSARLFLKQKLCACSTVKLLLKVTLFHELYLQPRR